MEIPLPTDIKVKYMYIYCNVHLGDQNNLFYMKEKEESLISMLLHKYEAGWRRTVAVWRRCNVANIDIIPTPFWHRDAGGTEVRGYTCVFICRFYKGKQIFDFLFASLDDETL